MIGRRDFLKGMAVAGAALVAPPLTVAEGLPFADRPAIVPASFDFVFLTDTHIEPELNAARGCDTCFRKIAALKPEFAIVGGDHVYDAMGVNGARAGMLFDLYKRTEHLLEIPLHRVIGNHDVFGV
jgi:3',5'-cyclic-AMP phosphodiesterase